MMDAMLTLLGQLGLGLATNAIYDLIKSTAAKPLPQGELQSAIQNQIRLHSINMQASTVMTALTRNGFISIQGSNLYAANSIVFGSVRGGATMGNNTTFRTDRTGISAGVGASIETRGNAQVRQNPDGSISFHTGDDGNIDFKT